MSDADSPILPPPAAWIIRPNELEVDEDARPGGRVAQGRWRSSLVIVKVISKQAEPSMVYERGELWTSLRHPNILQIFGMSPLDADPLYVVTSFQPNGNVTRFLHQNPHVDRTRIVLDVVLGMQYLHANQLVHGSLKPTNILVANDGKACISDCGMIEVQTSGSNGHRYFSPEAWKGTLSRPSDVFAWAMCALEIFGGQPPWGILSEKQIFRLVVREDCRPDRPDEDNGLTDHIWGLMEECWHRESRLRPTFDILAQLLQNAPRHLQPTNSSSSIPQLQVVVEPDYDQPSSGQHLLPPEHSLSPADALVSVHSRRAHYALSMQTQATGPPAYEVVLPTASHPGSAPPALSQFRPMSIVPPAKRPRDGFFQTPPRPPYVQEASDASSSSASPYDSFDEEGMSPMMNSLTLRSPETPMTPWSPERRLAPSPSVRTSSSGGSSGTRSSQNSRFAPQSKPIAPIGEESYFDAPRSLPTPPPRGLGYSKGKAPPTLPESPYLWHQSSTSTFPSEYSQTYSGAPTSSGEYPESVRSQPSTVNGTAPNAKLLAGALLTEVKEGRKREIINDYLAKIQKLGMRSHKEAQKLVTAGTVPTLIMLLKTRAADGIGLEAVLITLGILTHDPISANTIYRTSTSVTLIDILDAAQSDDIAALAVWCLSRICRSAEVADGLLKQNIAKLLVNKGLKGASRTSRISAWCLGALVHTDNIAEALAEIGLVTALCEHMRRCIDSLYSTPEDNSAAIYAVARISRSIKLSKALAKGGCVEMLTHYLITAEDARVLLWSARAVGCLMRPNSSDMAKILLDAGIARGLARLPSMLPTEEVEPLGAFAFAIQRFSCAEWGGGTRKALVDAGVVDSLLAALRTAADEPYPQVHIELAYAIALLGDVGGTAIRKEIVNAGGIDILKRVGGSAARADVTKACNLAATSIVGNVWSRNTASAKAALAHEWSGGCPDYLPACPVPLTEDSQPSEMW